MIFSISTTSSSTNFEIKNLTLLLTIDSGLINNNIEIQFVIHFFNANLMDKSFIEIY